MPLEIKQETLSLGEANADLLEVVDVDETQIKNEPVEEPTERQTPRKEEVDEDHTLNEEKNVEQTKKTEQEDLMTDLKDSSKVTLKPSTNADLNEA